MLRQTSVDVVIPVYRPGRDDKLIRALTMLQKQTAPVGRIVLMNTDESAYAAWAARERLTERFPDLIVRHVTKRDFDHARTRNEGAALSQAEYLLFMTMDAVPADASLTERLVAAMEQDRNCAIAYARQLPAVDAGEAERFTRKFNYPGTSSCKTLADERRLGVKASFASNVCAMYRRSVFDRLGGFAAPAIFNEDMVFAHAVLHAGYGIRYCAEAAVVHSHNYTAGEQLHRNFDLGVSQAMHPEVFAGVSSEREGKRLVAATVRHLYGAGHGVEIPGYLWTCAARYTGYLLGKHYRWLPRTVVLRLTNQQEFWR